MEANWPKGLEPRTGSDRVVRKLSESDAQKIVDRISMAKSGHPRRMALLVVACALSKASKGPGRHALRLMALRILLPMLESSALGILEDRVYDLAAEAIWRLFGEEKEECVRDDDDALFLGDKETAERMEISRSLLEAGISYRLLSVLKSTLVTQASRIQIYQVLTAVFKISSRHPLLLDFFDAPNLTQLILIDLGHKVFSAFELLAIVLSTSVNRDKVSALILADPLFSDKLSSALSEAARNEPGSKLACFSLNILDALANHKPFVDFCFPKRKYIHTKTTRTKHNNQPLRKNSFSSTWHRDDTYNTVIKNLYPSTSSKIALALFCKLAHLGIDEFAPYADADLALVLAPCAGTLLQLLDQIESSDRIQQQTTTALYALNALRFLCHNRYERALLDASHNADYILEKQATAALDACRRLDDRSHLPTVTNENRAAKSTSFYKISLTSAPRTHNNANKDPPTPLPPVDDTVQKEERARLAAENAAKTQLLRTVAYRAQALLQSLAP